MCAFDVIFVYDNVDASAKRWYDKAAMKSRSITPQRKLVGITSEAKDLAGLDKTEAARLVFLLTLINAFERSLIPLKANNAVWGPIHLSIGQEAHAAAMALSVKKSDKITGSHRAHHITLAKIVEALRPDDWVPGTAGAENGRVPEVISEAVYRTLAEIMGLEPGWCGGRGGSMHLRHAHAGVLGTNAIVAGGVPLSVGAALAAKKLGKKDVTLAFLGDGAIPQGSFHESCNLAAIWKLPIVFVVENNQYAVATAIKDVWATEELVQLAVAYGMQGYQVSGYDVLALREGFRKATETARKGKGPILLEIKGYRHFHHGGEQPGSRYGYRSTEEEEWWKGRDPYEHFPEVVQGAGLLTGKEIKAIQETAEATVDQAVARCTDDTRSAPKPELWPAASTVSEGVRSSGKELEGLAYHELEHFDRLTEMRYVEAIAAVTGRWMEKDESVVVLGEEVANFGGGAYAATKGLPQKYPERVFNTPISEGGFSGTGLGAAMSGLKPVVEIMFPDFALVAADQLFNQIGKARHMYGGTTDLPLVLRTRIATGVGYGGQHSMDPVGLYAMFSGWRIVAPSNAFDYIGLFNTAMHSLDPVCVLEHHSLYAEKGVVPEGDLDYCIPFGRAAVVKDGSDITVATYGGMTPKVLRVAEALESEGIIAEVVDLRTLDLANLDFDTLGTSLAKTGVVATVEEAAGGHAIGRRIASEVTERFFDSLDGPPGVITSKDVPNPVSRELERAAMISEKEIADRLRAMARRAWK